MFKDFVKVFEYYNGGYDWEAFTAYYSPSERQYFWHEDYEYPNITPLEDINSEDELENGSKEDLIRAWNKFAKSSYLLDDYERLNYVSIIREHN